MTAYAVAHVHSVEFGPEIAEYLRRIDDTMAPFGGRWVVHGGDVEVVEGDWGPFVIIISFPDRKVAWAWYNSPAYQEIAPLRTRNSHFDIIFASAAPEGHRGADLLQGNTTVSDT